MPYERDPPGTGDPEFSSTGERISAAAAEARSRASGLGERATDQVYRARTSAAGGMESAADTLHESGEEGARRVARAAHSAADALESGADYLREHDMREMMVDLMEVVKNNPGPALLSAAAVGFLVGRAFSRD